MTSSPLSIGYAGGLVPEKGVDLLLRACAGLTGDWRLTLAGEGESRAELERLAAALRIADRVHFAGRIASGAMPAFYQGLDVLVLPSRTRPNWKEQFGRVLVEAMACGVVVVGSDCGEIPQVIGDAGLIFPEEDVDALRARLQHLIDDLPARERLAAAGRARVLAHFTMQQIRAQTGKIDKKILIGTFDDHTMLDFLPNRVFSIRQNEDALARRVFERLIEPLGSSKRSSAVDTVPTELICRNL